ncbi:MAG: DUF4352 domain-containing protein [Frankiales bacterium]|nr:DUF4352 domain-containing protein [Frankiales bacterium]
MSRRLAVVVAAAPLALAACAGSTGSTSPPPGPATRTHFHPGPVRTVVRTSHRVPAGHNVVITGQGGASVSITASRPSVSTHALSSSYGYPPSHGHYVTFHLTVVDIGSTPVLVDPHDFALHVTGEGTVSSYDGNAPYSGASSQLDRTQLEPGDKVTAPLTFDVRTPHGRLTYSPDRSPAVVWTF